MEAGFPDMSMILNIIFFLLVALFLIVVAKMIMDESKPEFVISGAFLPLGLKLRKKGLGGLPVMIVLMIVVAALMLAVWMAAQAGIIKIPGLFGDLPYGYA